MCHFPTDICRMGYIVTRYVIRPNEAFRHDLAASGSKLVDVFDQLALWTRTEGHRSRWRDEDRAAQIKLLFVADVKTDFGDDADFKRLFADFPIATATFDLYWVLERIDDEQDVDQVIANIAPSAIAEFRLTGRPLVDDWISDLRREKLEERQ